MRHGASSVVAALLSLASGVGLPPALAEGAAGAISWGESYAAALPGAFDSCLHIIAMLKSEIRRFGL